MGAIVAEGSPDMKALKAHLEASLPHYARPVFLRLSEESDTTSTFKFKKTNLVKAGFDPANISEPIYFANPATGKYEKVTPEIFKKISSGEVRL
jgi:fatty-acyl-CoA synthase